MFELNVLCAPRQTGFCDPSAFPPMESSEMSILTHLNEWLEMKK
jgi:hypothetical protein